MRFLLKHFWNLFGVVASFMLLWFYISPVFFEHGPHSAGVVMRVFAVLVAVSLMIPVIIDLVGKIR